MGRHLRVLAASAMLMLTLSATARATSVPGPSSMSTGFDDFSAFQQVSPSAGALWFSRARALGARTVRLTVYWSGVAAPYPAAGLPSLKPGRRRL